MDEHTFADFVERQHKIRVSILNSSTKKRMAGSDDRLLQFKRMAVMRRCTPESAAIDLATKHFTDFLDMAAGTNPRWDDFNYFSELGADIQNYIDLTLALMYEKNEPSPSKAPHKEDNTNVFKSSMG